MTEEQKREQQRNRESHTKPLPKDVRSENATDDVAAKAQRPRDDRLQRKGVNKPRIYTPAQRKAKNKRNLEYMRERRKTGKTRGEVPAHATDDVQKKGEAAIS